MSAGSLSIQPFEGSPVWPSVVMGFECYQPDERGGRTSCRWGWRREMNDALDEKIQGFAWGSIAESALGHTSGDRPGAYKEFELRKIDS